MTLSMKIKKLYTNILWKIKIFVILVLTSSVFVTVNQSLLFRNEEKLVAIVVYSSFVRVATSDFRIILYSLEVVVVCAQMFTTALQHGIVRVVLVKSPD